MTYELKTNPKLVALAAVGAEVLGVNLNDELKRPIVVERPAAGNGTLAPAAAAQDGKGVAV